MVHLQRHQRKTFRPGKLALHRISRKNCSTGRWQIWRPYLQPSFRRLRTNTQSCIQGSEIPKKGNIDRFLLAKKPRWCISTAKVMRMQWLMQEYVISEHNSKFLSLIAKIITTCTLQGRVEKISKDILLRSIGYFSSYLAIRSSFARLEIDFYKKLLPDATKSFISVLKLIIAIVKVFWRRFLISRQRQRIHLEFSPKSCNQTTFW